MLSGSLCDGLITIQGGPTECVSMSVIVQPRQRGGPGPLGAVETRKKNGVLRLRVCTVLTGLPMSNTLDAVRPNALHYLITQHNRLSCDFEGTHEMRQL